MKQKCYKIDPRGQTIVYVLVLRSEVWKSSKKKHVYIVQLLFTGSTVRAHYKEQSFAVYCDKGYTHTQSFSLGAQLGDFERCSRRQPLPLKSEHSVTIFVPSGLALKMLFYTHKLYLFAPHGSQLRMNSGKWLSTENKQRLFPYTKLADWFLQPRWSMFTARYEVKFKIKTFKFNCCL